MSETDNASVQPKGYDIAQLGINLRKKEDLLQEVLNTTPKPLTSLYGIGNIKDVVSLLCGLVNTAARRAGYMGYIGLLPDVFAAVSGFNLVLEEIVDMDEEEYEELKAFAIVKLDLPEAQDALEVLAEGIVYHALGLIMLTVRYFRTVGATKPL